MKKKRKLITWGIMLALLIGLFQPLIAPETYEAATSYTNAKEFYDSTAKEGDYYHAEAAYGRVYYATQAKLAYSSTNTRYYTVGFDVTLSGNGHSVSFTVQRSGGSMTQVGNSIVSGKYEYNLYVITEDKLFELATKADSANAAYVLSASTINVKMDAIMTTISSGKTTPNGGITENGSGGFTKWGTIYRMKNSSDLKAIKEIFSGHEFKSYKDIKVDLENYNLNVHYAVNGTPEVIASSSTKATVSSSYKLANYTKDGVVTPYVLYNSNKTIYTSSGRTLNKITLLNPASIGLSKTGYYLPSGNEWITAYRIAFAGNTAYQATSLCADVGHEDSDITLYANWKPNAINITYNANGGLGTMSQTNTTYDKETYLTQNSFTRTGYTFKGWNTEEDGSGKAYADMENVTNMITGGDVTLFAQWEPCVYKITTNINYEKKSPVNDNDSDGTSYFYEKFATGFYTDAAALMDITSISVPSRTGYTFMGYYTYMQGGQILVDATGKISVSSSFFINDSTIYADFDANQYTVTYDKQGGLFGTDSKIATYDKVFPAADAPTRDGYSFQGYFTGENGTGTRIYNENMASDTIFTYTKNITLYAYWVDDLAPELTFRVSHDTWTNEEVTLTAEAKDYGKGLSAVVIYRVNTDGSLKKVAAATGLNGAKTKLLSFVNTDEGIVRYKAFAIDMNGCTVEAYNVAYYDITAPTGIVIEEDIDNGTFDFEIDITDINTGD